MSCPTPEDLTRWSDGALDERVIAAHVESCAACRRQVEEWKRLGEGLASAEPGPGCLAAEEMAALLEGRPAPAHVEACPRCAAELAALRPAKRRITFRTARQPSALVAWAAAGAAALLLIVLVAVSTSPRPKLALTVETVAAPSAPAPVERVEPAPPVVAPPVPAKHDPAPVAPEPRPPQTSPPVEPPRPPEPAPAPAVAKPESPKPAETRPTAVEPPRKEAAFAVRSGGISRQADGKWTPAQRAPEGTLLRADGRTSLDFARARITLDGASRFTLAEEELTLSEGGLSAEVAPGSKFTLALGGVRIAPAAVLGRVLLCARPDRIFIEEGFARAGEMLLPEGVEHHLKKDRLEAQKRRTLPAAARPRESMTWRLDLAGASARKGGLSGRVDQTAQGRVLASVPNEDKSVFYAYVGYAVFEERGLFTVRPNTAVRFRYYLVQPAPLQFVAWNQTKEENFNLELQTVHGQWTTVTLFMRDVPANPGGKRVACEAGDRYRGVGLHVGKPDTPADVLIDQLEIVEIER